MEEKFNNFQQEIKQLNEQAENNKKSYSINRRDDEYESNLNYENYDNEIINGENVFDCQIENVKRQSKILSLYNEIIEKCEKIKNEGQFGKRKKKRQKNIFDKKRNKNTI